MLRARPGPPTSTAAPAMQPPQLPRQPCRCTWLAAAKAGKPAQTALQAFATTQPPACITAMLPRRLARHLPTAQLPAALQVLELDYTHSGELCNYTAEVFDYQTYMVDEVRLVGKEPVAPLLSLTCVPCAAERAVNLKRRTGSTPHLHEWAPAR